MQAFEEFIEKQNSIYNRMENQDASKVNSEGIKRNFEDQGAYLIALRHPLNVVETIEEFTTRLSKIVPCISYGSHNLHTTISDYHLTPLNKFSPHEDILKKLSLAAYKTSKNVHDTNSSISINYSDWLFNQGSIIIAGQATRNFFNICNCFLEKAKKENIELRQPWGSHITAARFTGARTPGQLEEFFSLLNQFPQIPSSIPNYLDIGFFRMSDKGFNFTIYDRLNNNNNT